LFFDQSTKKEKKKKREREKKCMILHSFYFRFVYALFDGSRVVDSLRAGGWALQRAANTCETKPERQKKKKNKSKPSSFNFALDITKMTSICTVCRLSPSECQVMNLFSKRLVPLTLEEIEIENLVQGSRL
jgi:hypothetical protein